MSDRPKVDETYNLAVLFPVAAKEWHPTKYNDLKPSEIAPYSQQKYWWQCEKGHEWKATVNTRTNMNSGCRQCSNQSSRDEIRLLAELSWVFDSVKSRFKVTGRELDVFIKELSVGVEFDGSHWHKDKENADRQKNEFMAQNGIKVIRFREEPLCMIGEEDIRVDRNKGISKHHIDDLLSKLEHSSDKVEQYLAHDEFINEDMYLTYLEYFPSPFP